MTHIADLRLLMIHALLLQTMLCVDTHGAVTTFAERAPFEADLVSTVIEPFVDPFATGSSVDFGPFVASTEDTTFLEHVDTTMRKAGKNNTANTVTFTFDQPVFAFGVDILDFGNPSDGHLAVSTDTGSLNEVVAQYMNGDPEINLFFGVIDPDGFTSIVFSNTTEGDSMFYDTLTYTLENCFLADIDDDGNVGFSDLTAVLLQWGMCPAGCDADVDSDGTVGFDDLSAVLLAWGRCKEA